LQDQDYHLCVSLCSFEVVEVLQEVCGLRNVTKNTEDGIVQLTCLVDAHVGVVTTSHGLF